MCSDNSIALCQLIGVIRYDRFICLRVVLDCFPLVCQWCSALCISSLCGVAAYRFDFNPTCTSNICTRPNSSIEHHLAHLVYEIFLRSHLCARKSFVVVEETFRCVFVIRNC